MRFKFAIVLVIITATTLFCYFTCLVGNEKQKSQAAGTHEMHPRPELDEINMLPTELIQNGLIEESGESHVLALETIMDWINQQLVLTDEDRNVMIAYISQSKPDTIEAGAWQERVNEILNFLRSQPGAVPGLSDLLLRMASKDPDPVMRMYALQHIALWIPSEPNEQNKQSMIAYLEKLASNNKDPLAWSAVLFLNDLDHNDNLPESINAEQINAAALRLVAMNSISADVRICALHTCADRGLTGAIKDSRSIAQDDSLMIPLRKAAIYTLGEVGSPDDIELLEALAASNDVLEASTSPAIKRIQIRVKQ